MQKEKEVTEKFMVPQVYELFRFGGSSVKDDEMGIQRMLRNFSGLFTEEQLLFSDYLEISLCLGNVFAPMHWPITVLKGGPMAALMRAGEKLCTLRFIFQDFRTVHRSPVHTTHCYTLRRELPQPDG